MRQWLWKSRCFVTVNLDEICTVLRNDSRTSCTCIYRAERVMSQPAEGDTWLAQLSYEEVTTLQPQKIPGHNCHWYHRSSSAVLREGGNRRFRRRSLCTSNQPLHRISVD